MRPTNFAQSNRTWGAGQPGFNALPAYSDDRVTVSCWALTWRDRLRLLWNGVLWVSLQNFGRPLQGQLLSVESPLVTVRRAGGCREVVGG